MHGSNLRAVHMSTCKIRQSYCVVSLGIASCHIMDTKRVPLRRHVGGTYDGTSWRVRVTTVAVETQ
jgi:hypothetical protein